MLAQRGGPGADFGLLNKISKDEKYCSLSTWKLEYGRKLALFILSNVQELASLAETYRLSNTLFSLKVWLRNSFP